ncbi:SDR family oxidoreductase [Clostridium sp. 'White wine YQ']|uniref:SDR family oxidoreductase n=1 Tax=Clostridium sp. 'White wine YQ' TaxID=3027474 RepID=UPI0023668CB6|nr:sugar nucleotide-binding protein [Clostridium sp. 'White wine YQ']MDD7793905.1 sugar nucleotide-binding protein [Clostridium sp. 'White wine YQ']
MKKILVTGAEGFFASRFIEYYKNEFNIVALNKKDLEITKEESIEQIKYINPDYVVHAAAISDTGLCERNPELSYKVNVEGSINVAKGCEASKAKLIYLSSDQVYNANIQSGPYSEECIVVPNTVYGKHKIEAENHIAKMVDDAVILRLTWLFSLPERNKKVNSNIIWNIIKAAVKNQSISLPANEYRGITYVYDLIRNISKIINIPGGIYNAGSENNLSTYEIGKSIIEQMGLSNRVEDILIKDTDRYKDSKRDLRISNKKLNNMDVSFPDTQEAIINCLKEFSYLNL